MKTEVNEVSRKWERKAKMIKMGFRERREKERGKKVNVKRESGIR